MYVTIASIFLQKQNISFVDVRSMKNNTFWWRRLRKKTLTTMEMKKKISISFLCQNLMIMLCLKFKLFILIGWKAENTNDTKKRHSNPIFYGCIKKFNPPIQLWQLTYPFILILIVNLSLQKSSSNRFKPIQH